MHIKVHARQLHHISSHFTNGLFPAASVFVTLFLLTKNPLFETASFYSCVIGTISAPIVFGSGLLDWRIRLEKRSARIFSQKISTGIALLFLSIFMVVFRLSFDHDPSAAGATRYIYAGIVYTMTGMATYLGYLGGKFIV